MAVAVADLVTCRIVGGSAYNGGVPMTTYPRSRPRLASAFVFLMFTTASAFAARAYYGFFSGVLEAGAFTVITLQPRVGEAGLARSTFLWLASL
jgi:hypothetical protein